MTTMDEISKGIGVARAARKVGLAREWHVGQNSGGDTLKYGSGTWALKPKMSGHSSNPDLVETGIERLRFGGGLTRKGKVAAGATGATGAAGAGGVAATQRKKRRSS